MGQTTSGGGTRRFGFAIRRPFNLRIHFIRVARSAWIFRVGRPAVMEDAAEPASIHGGIDSTPCNERVRGPHAVRISSKATTTRPATRQSAKGSTLVTVAASTVPELSAQRRIPPSPSSPTRTALRMSSHPLSRAVPSRRIDAATRPLPTYYPTPSTREIRVFPPPAPGGSR
jgi:hypothetical protein